MFDIKLCFLTASFFIVANNGDCSFDSLQLPNFPIQFGTSIQPSGLKSTRQPSILWNMIYHSKAWVDFGLPKEPDTGKFH